MKQIQSYWDRRPCNLRHSPSTLGSAQYFKEVETRKYFVERHIPKFADFARWKSKRVLEVGFGIGTDAINFARAGAIYTGIELSFKSLALTKRRFEIEGLSARLLWGNAESLLELLPVAEQESFDLIYSFGVLHHTPRPQEVLESFYRLVAPAGEVRLMLYAKRSFKYWSIDHFSGQPEAQSNCPLARFYTKKEVRQLLKDFVLKQVKQDHIFPYLVGDYKMYRYRKRWFYRFLPSLIFRALEKLFGAHLLVQASPRK